jgi:peroxiredoxin
MRLFPLSISFLLLPVLAFTQEQSFEVSGTIKGAYKSKMYFFYEDHYRQKDSISAEIKNGRFYFKASAPLPVQARFHLDQQSTIQDVYIDAGKTVLTCTNAIRIYGKDKDTLNWLQVTAVTGSQSESLKRDFEKRLSLLMESKKTEEARRQAYYNRLYAFTKAHPASRVSAYLIGKASLLRYAQINSLRSLLDASLQNTFEARTIAQLLNNHEKSGNKTIGNPFLDVTLRDTAGTAINTKDLRGKYLLIDFWASWCKPCRQLNPDLKNLYSKLKEKDFEILGVSFDKDQQRWKGAIVKDGLPWLQLLDEKGFYGVLATHYAIEAIPQNILLDKEGKIMGAGLSALEVGELVGKTR